MQDMRHYVPDYLQVLYARSVRGSDDVRVQLSQSFQKSMFCVTEAAIRGLMPFPVDTSELKEQEANRSYLNGWMKRMCQSRMNMVQ